LKIEHLTLSLTLNLVQSHDGFLVIKRRFLYFFKPILSIAFQSILLFQGNVTLNIVVLDKEISVLIILVIANPEHWDEAI